VRIKQELGFITTGIMPDTGRRPSSPVKAGYGNAVSILETLARVQVDPEYVNFAEYMLKSGVGIPNGTKVFVVSPPLKEAEATALMAHRRKGYKIELFEIRSRHMNKAEEWLHDIKTHDVTERGEEVVHG
jgi:adenylyl- and sulfurtransferase ThiI